MFFEIWIFLSVASVLYYPLAFAGPERQSLAEGAGRGRAGRCQLSGGRGVLRESAGARGGRPHTRRVHGSAVAACENHREREGAR